MSFAPAVVGTATDLLKKLSSNPQNKKIIDFALAQGLSEEDLSRYLSSRSMSPSERSDISRKMSGKKDLETLLSFLKKGISVAATGLGGYALYKGGMSIAKSLASNSNLAKSALGISDSFGQNLAESALGIGEKALGEVAEGKSLKSVGKGILGSIFSLFGTRSKSVGDAVSKVAESTGKNVQEIHDELAKDYDLSTPEKIVSAIKEKFGGEREPGGKEFKAKTFEQTKRELAKDLKSAVIRKTEYDKDKNTLRVVFNSGRAYEYYNVPENVAEDLNKGGIAAKTKGENEYGKWWVGKDPSAGASFNDLIKKGGYEYKMVSDNAISPEEEKEYRSIAQEKKKGGKKIETAEKISALKKESPVRKAETKLFLRADQLNKDIQALSSLEPGERHSNIKRYISKRLKDIQNAKGKFRDEIAADFDRQYGFPMLKRLIRYLPARLIKKVKSIMDTSSEAEILQFIQKNI